MAAKKKLPTALKAFKMTAKHNTPTKAVAKGKKITKKKGS